MDDKIEPIGIYQLQSSNKNSKPVQKKKLLELIEIFNKDVNCIEKYRECILILIIEYYRQEESVGLFSTKKEVLGLCNIDLESLIMEKIPAIRVEGKNTVIDLDLLPSKLQNMLIKLSDITE